MKHADAVNAYLLLTKFWLNIEKQSDGCWLWLANESERYGRIYLSKIGLLSVHRFAYELLKGDIPSNAVLDHLCRNTKCVNPEHLEPVTNKTNILRGKGHAALNAAKTHCPKGHPYDTENTYVIKGGIGRGCKTCRIQWANDNREKVRVISRASTARWRAKQKQISHSE